MAKTEVRYYRVSTLPAKGKDGDIYFVPNGSGTFLDQYVADKNGDLRYVGKVPYYFQNANNVTFGTSGSVVTASINPVGGNFGASASNSSITFNTLSFGNSNGLSFYITNGSIVGSYTLPAAIDTSGFQQTSQMSNYLDTSYTSHSHSQYLNTSQSSVFQYSSLMTNYLGTDYASHTHSQYVNNSVSSNFQQVSDMPNYLGTSYTSHTHSQYVNTSISSNFQQTSLMTNYLGNTYTTHTHSQYLTTQSYQPIAVSDTANSSTLNTLQLGTLNGLTLYITNGSLAGSYTDGGGAGADGLNRISAGTQIAGTNATVVLSNSNNVSFGMSNNSVITASASYSQPTDYVSTAQSSLFQQTSLMSDYLQTNYTSHTHSQYLNTSQSSLFEQTSHTTIFLTSQSNQAVSAANGSFTFQTLTLANSNGVSFSTGTQGLYASYTVPTVTNSSLTLGAGTQTLSSVSQILFNNANGISFGASTSNNGSVTITASHNGITQQSTQPVAVSGTNGSFAFSTLTLGALNGLSFYTSNNSIVASYTVPTQTVQTQNLVSINGSTGNISFSNGNGVTFGANASTITASHNGITSQSNQNLSLFGLGNTTQNSSSVLGAAALSLNAIGSLTVGFSNGSIQLSAPNALTSQSNQAFSGSNASSTFQTISFGSSNGMHFYLTNGSLVGSYTVPSQTVQPVAASGSNGSFNFSTLSLGSSNGMHFYTTNGSLVGSYTVPTQSVQTQNLVSIQGSTGNITFANANGITFGFNASTITASHNGITSQTNQSLGLYAVGNTTLSSSNTVDARTLSFQGAGIVSVGVSNGSVVVSASAAGAADGYNILAAGTQTANTTGTVLLQNSNGITFGMSNNSVITASHNGLTQQSTQPVAASGSNGSFTFSTISLGSSNGMHFYTTNGSIVGSYTVPSTAGLISAINLSAGTTSNNLTAATFSNSNGVSFGLNGSVITASHNGLTQQSTQPVALSGSNGSFAFSTATFGNSNGLSFYTTNGSLVGSYTVPTQSVQTQNMVSIQGSTGNITFANANGITFGFNASTVTASHNGITSQSNQNISLFGLGNTTQNSSTVLNASNLSFNAIGSLTVGYSNGSIQLSAPNALTSQSNQAFSGSNASSTFQTITFGSSNGMHFYLTNGSLVGSYTVPSQTVQPVALSGSNGSFNFSTATFGNLNGISFYTSNGSLVASHNGITSQTNQNISLYALGNTTQNSSTLLNASNLSFNGLGNASIGFSNGSIQISVTGGGGGVTPVASASNGSFSFTTLAFSNANNVTFGTSTGGIITASVAAPGAAAENNWINLVGANTAGNTTASGSTIAYSAINLTLSGTNGSVVNISAPATSSLSATGQLSISVNGSTVSIGVPDKVMNSVWEPFDERNNTAFSAPGQNSIYIQRLWPDNNYTFSSIEQHASLSFVSSTNSQVVAYTWDYGLYARDTGTNSTRMTLSASSQMIFQASYNSNTAAGFTVSGGGTSFTTSSGGTGIFTNITAGRHLYFPFAGSVSEGGEYGVAWRVSSASTVGTSPLRMSALVFTNINNLTWGKIYNTTVLATNASFVEDFAQGVYSVTSANLVTSFAESQLTNAVSRARQYLMFEVS